MGDRDEDCVCAVLFKLSWCWSCRPEGKEGTMRLCYTGEEGTGNTKKPKVGVWWVSEC